jgi:hypothetical protein
MNLLALGFIIYLTFFKSYFQEKGKRLAIKDDIDEITSRVEKIKTEFSQETERLKYELDFFTQNKFSLAAEEREAILGFHDSFSIWLHTIINPYPTVLKQAETRDEKLNELKENMSEAQRKLEIMESRVNLLLNDEYFEKLCKPIENKTIKLQGNKQFWLLEAKFIYDDQDEVHLTHPQNVEQEKERLNQLFKQKDKEYGDKELQLLRDVYEHLGAMQDYLREKLYAILRSNENNYKK